MLIDDLVIRKATSSDQELLYWLLYLSIYHLPGTPNPPEAIIKAPQIAHYVESWGKEGDFALIAFLRDEAIGGIWMRYFSSDDAGYGFIAPDIPELGMAVERKYRGKKVGSLLLGRFLESLPQEVHSLSLSVQLENRALGLYRRFGFRDYRVDGDSLVMLFERS